MAKMPSVMSHAFSQSPQAEIPRSSFNRSHGYKTTFNSGMLIPIFCDEALPGDTFNIRMTGFARLATPLHPFMDNLFMSTFFFAVPARLLWENWQAFNGEQDKPGAPTDFLVPQMTSPAGGYLAGTMSDYMGIPTTIAGIDHSALWHRAYNQIYNEWFRDENLQDPVPVNTGDGPDDPADYQLMRRGKRHDYFTSALPWPQKGPSVQLPLGTTAPIKGIGKADQNFPLLNQPFYETGATGTRQYSSAARIFGDPTENYAVEQDPDNPGYPAIYADLSAATAATINQLRQAFQIQKIYERDARGGTRYTEIIRSHFGVTSPDARLQRPEYLGGGTSPVNVQPVPQTSKSDETAPASPQGNLAAYATSVISGHGFTKSFTEHSIVIGLISVRADVNYQQGLNRMFSRRTRWDFYWPALSHIGEQTILNKEIYAQGTDDDELVFGYQERFAEYRYKPSQITGEFRSKFAQSLDTWHLAQDFENLPLLNSEFIVEDPPVKRVVAVQTSPEFLFDSYFQFKCARPMPIYGVPGMIDHF